MKMQKNIIKRRKISNILYSTILKLKSLKAMIYKGLHDFFKKIFFQKNAESLDL